MLTKNEKFESFVMASLVLFGIVTGDLLLSSLFARDKAVASKDQQSQKQDSMEFFFGDVQRIGGWENARMVFHGPTGKMFIVVTSPNQVAIAPIDVETVVSDEDEVPQPKIEAVSSWPERQ